MVAFHSLLELEGTRAYCVERKLVSVGFDGLGGDHQRCIVAHGGEEYRRGLGKRHLYGIVVNDLDALKLHNLRGKPGGAFFGLIPVHYKLHSLGVEGGTVVKHNALLELEDDGGFILYIPAFGQARDEIAAGVHADKRLVYLCVEIVVRVLRVGLGWVQGRLFYALCHNQGAAAHRLAFGRRKSHACDGQNQCQDTRQYFFHRFLLLFSGYVFQF